MVNSLEGSAWRSWEKEASTRSSVHLLTKYVPIDVTLAVAGTAQDLAAVSTELPTVNLVTNPSMETGDPPTGFTAVGATLSRSAVIARTGSNSLLINPNNVAAGEGGYWTLPALVTAAPSDNPNILVASCYLNDNAGSGDGARIIIADSTGVALATGNTITLAAAWNRTTAFYPLTRAQAVYRLYLVTVLQHNTNFYADSLQAELLQNSIATTYCDGAQGIQYRWNAGAHASTSRRLRGLIEIRGYRLHTTRDIYVSYDVTASSTTGEFVRAGSDFTASGLLIGSNISFINAVAGELPRVHGSAWGLHEEA